MRKIALAAALAAGLGTIGGMPVAGQPLGAALLPEPPELREPDAPTRRNRNRLNNKLRQRAKQRRAARQDHARRMFHGRRAATRKAARDPRQDFVQRMTGWQRTKWMRAGGDLDRAEEFARLARLEGKTLGAPRAAGIARPA